MIKKTLIFCCLFTVLLIVFSGCDKNEKEKMQLTVGVMPAVDSAPIYLAYKLGYFEEENLDVEIKLFTNATERQSALQTHSIDGAMSDLIALIINVQSGFELKGTTLTDGLFPFLSKEGLNYGDEISVAVMEVSVSNFIADILLENKFTTRKIYINEIPARLEMVKSGNADMGVFPEPLATVGALDGLTRTSYDSQLEYSPDIFVFTHRAISEKKDEVEAFHRAYNKAVEAISEDKEIAKDILIEKLNLNPRIKDSLELPDYNKAMLPGDAFVNMIIDWIGTSLGIDIDISIDDLFYEGFVSDD